MHSFTDEEMVERASLYALGALSQGEARAFEEHLDEGCERCAAELKDFEDVTAALSFAAPESAPSAVVREKLLSLVADEKGLETTQPAQAGNSQQLITLRASEGLWQEVAKGISVKQLFVDKESGMVTTLVRMLPGTHIPLHRHSGVEQCYVIEGDFHADNQSLGAGDFHCAKAGSVHQPVYTVNGALVLIIAPKEYEPLEHR